MDGVGSRGNCSNRSSTDEGLEDDDEDNDEDADDMQSSDESLSGNTILQTFVYKKSEKKRAMNNCEKNLLNFGYLIS